MYYLCRSDDRYVIREDENPRSLVKNAARDVESTDAMELIGDTIESVFGNGACVVGFSDEHQGVPDNQQIKVAVRNGPWSEDSRVVRSKSRRWPASPGIPAG